MRPWRDLIVIVLFLCPVLGVGIEGEEQTAANDAAKSSATASSADQRARVYRDVSLCGERAGARGAEQGD